MNKKCEDDASNFPAILIAYSLGFVSDPRIPVILERAAHFLQSQMEGCGLWRFWSTGHLKRWMIPLDADDTSCASLVLHGRGVVVSGNRNVLLANRNQNGLFYTWIFPRRHTFHNPAFWKLPLKEIFGSIRYKLIWKITEAEPNDIDAVVNANILAYLGNGEHAAKIIRWFETILLEKREAHFDKWYLEPLILHYMISRARFCGVTSLNAITGLLAERISEELPIAVRARNPLLTALGVCAWLNLEKPCETLAPAVDLLLEVQKSDGSWPRLPFFWGGPKRLTCWGGRELTTAFCLEALSRVESVPHGEPE